MSSTKCINWLYSILIISSFFSCIPSDKNNTPSSKTEFPISTIESIVFPKELGLEPEPTTDYLIVVVFNGECSSCIVSFLQFANQINKRESKVTTVYISYSEELYTVEHYLDLNKANLKTNQILIADRQRSFEKHNPFAHGDPINVMLVKNGKILVTGSPFEFQEVHNKYVEHGILNG